MEISVRSPHQCGAVKELSCLFKPNGGPALMEQIRPNDPVGASFKARIVKDIIKPTKSISYKVSIKAALDEMEARAIDSAPVTDERGELLGTLSKNKMNRDVGGLGHDPETEPVEAHIEKHSAYCFKAQN